MGTFCPGSRVSCPAALLPWAVLPSSSGLPFHLQPLLGLVHFSLSPRPARWISSIFHPSHLGPCQGYAVSSLLFNMCQAICQNSGPRAPGTGEQSSSKARPQQPLSAGPAGKNRLQGLEGGGAGQLPGGTPAQQGEGRLVRSLTSPG